MPAPNVLFLVHGMGSNLGSSAAPSGPWFKEVEAALHTAWRRFPSLARESFADYIELCPLTYDDRFRRYTARLADAGELLKQTIGPARYAEALAAVAGAGADDEDDFLWANVMDVVLYRFGGDFNIDVQSALLLQLARKVEEAWAARTGSPVQFSMLSHSLGTAVAHGMLQRSALGAIGTSRVLRYGNGFKLRCYMTLANTSRVLFRGGSIYDATLIRPDKYVETFINVSHIADPVPAPMRFAPATWGAGYRALELKHYRDLNVHGFTHYLDHPRVAGALFRSLVPYLLTDAEIAAVDAAYPDVEDRYLSKRTAIEQMIADVAQELRDAYDDETNIITDSVELIAGVARRAWKSRAALKALL